MGQIFNRGWALISHPAALALVCLGGVGFAIQAENAWATVPFALCLAAVLASLLFIATSRVAFSIYAGWSIVGLLTVVSAIKYKMKGFSLHFYDAVFFAGDPEIYRFLLSSYLYLVVPVAVALATVVALSIIVHRRDSRSGWALPSRLLLTAALSALLVVTFPVDASKERFFYYMQGRHLSASFVSLLDLGNLFLPNKLEQRLAGLPPQPPVSDRVECGDTRNLPDVYFVLSESVGDPAIFPQISGGADFLHRFAPSAGKPRAMTVETFGGGTWITNLSLMTGVSAMDFGWRSPYLTLTLQDKVSGSLPQLFAQCGYRTVALLPMDYTFVNEGPFLKSIGFETILDINDIGASFYHLRDEFYFRAAEEFIARHRKEDGRPLFLEIQTMFPHSPYLDRLEPLLAVDGEPFSDQSDVAEYLRRVAIARGDLQSFLDKRYADSSARGSIVLEFGDHQSFVTKPFVDELAGGDALSDPRSLAYRTYFTVTPINYAMRQAMPDVTSLDIGFVGASLLEAAGLPMSPMMADLARLRDLCQGRFHTCDDRGAVDRHLRSRLDAGLLKLAPGPGRSEPIVAGLR